MRYSCFDDNQENLMPIPIIDLHCDLLFYLEQQVQRTPYDLSARCSIPQLKQGHVKLQTMAIFTETGTCSKEKGNKQAKIYQQLPLQCPQDVEHYSANWKLDSKRTALLLAFENASGFCEEKEPFQEGLKRLKTVTQEITKPLYISLTWNTENRFGGGALTRIGLKEDGKHLLEELHQQQIAVDLSHASDALAYEMLDFIEGKALDIPVMASHSNARTITQVPRNLPDEIAREIFRRQGLVGLNFYRPFVGQTEEDLVKHLAHWLELGGEEAIALGADFFYDPDLPAVSQYGKDVFFPNYQNASCYGRLVDFVQKEMKLTPVFVEKLAHQNSLSFIQKLQ